MNQSKIHLLDLPNEILIIILKKLGNIDILYSLFGIKNERIDALIEEDVFISILNFVRTSSITDDKLDRLCTYILPEKHNYIRKLILDTTYMERILLAGDYPNLNSLELFNFGQEIVSRYFTDNTVFRHIFKHQITDLILHNNDEYPDKIQLNIYIENVYVHIMDLFQNLKHLTFVSSSVDDYPPLSLYILPPTICFSSTLIILRINVAIFDDCLALLDGRLKQLNTFIVQVEHIYYTRATHNMDGLHNLKYFSLTSYGVTYSYHVLVVPLLRRMTHLEKLTLYLRINTDGPFIDGTHLHNEILIYMSQLRTFTFYISTENRIYNLLRPISIDNIQQTFTNIKYGQTACHIDYLEMFTTVCHVYSLPFTFTRLEQISSKFSNIVFDTVTHLYVDDFILLKHEFFMRISRAFPMLKRFSLKSGTLQSWDDDTMEFDENLYDSIIEYPHLISLDLMRAHTDYVRQFLLETKAHLLCLTELKVKYGQLIAATRYFTIDAMRRNCSKVNRLIVENSRCFSKDVYQYFPPL